VNTVTNICVSKYMDNFLTNRGHVRFSRRFLLHGVRLKVWKLFLFYFLLLCVKSSLLIHFYRIVQSILNIFPDRPCGPPSLLLNEYGVFPRGLSGQGVALTNHPQLKSWLKKEKSYTSTPHLGLVACYRVTFTFYFTLYIFTYLKAVHPFARHDLHTK
jgi:hypothetical protein